MASKKIVIKTNIHCDKCKTEVLSSVTRLSGIEQTLTIIGEVDPVLIVNKVKKVGKYADITSVGPNPINPNPTPPPPPISPNPTPPPSPINPPPPYPDHLLIPINHYETSECIIL